MRQARTLVLIVVVAAGIIGPRIARLNWATNRDVAWYAVVAHEVLAGEQLYTTVFEHKLPGIHMIYAAAEMVFGYGKAQPLVLGIMTAMLTAIGVYLLGSRLGASPSAGLWAAAVWMVLSWNLELEVHDPNCESFLNPLILAFACMVYRAYSRPFRRRDAVLLGAFIGVAIVIKQIVILSIAPVFLLVIVSPPVPLIRLRVLQNLAICIGVALLPCLAIVGYFFFEGRLDDFVFANWTYNQEYAGSIVRNLKVSLLPEMLLPFRFPFLWPLVGVAVAASTVGLLTRQRRDWLLLLSLVAGAHLAVLAPGRFYLHYYQLYLPFLAVAIGWIPLMIARSARFHPFFSAAVPTLVLVLLMIHEVPRLVGSERDWRYGLYIDTKEAAEALAEITDPDDRLYQWGGEAGLFFYSGRRPASGVVLGFFLVSEKHGAKFTDWTLVDLADTRVRYLGVARWFSRTYGTDSPIISELLARARPLPELSTPAFTVYEIMDQSDSQADSIDSGFQFDNMVRDLQLYSP